MKVFIMWSGDRSRTVAIAMHRFLRAVVQGPDYFISTDKIEKGEVWERVITAALEDTTFGIACLTQEAVASPWVHFEAGAISRAGAKTARVVPYLIGIRDAEVAGPLTKFQMTAATREGTRGLVTSLNTARPQPERISEDALDDAFEHGWARLSKVLEELPPPAAPARAAQQTAHRDAADVQKETLELVRELVRIQRRLSAADEAQLVDPMSLVRGPILTHRELESLRRRHEDPRLEVRRVRDVDVVRRASAGLGPVEPAMQSLASMSPEVLDRLRTVITPALRSEFEEYVHSLERSAGPPLKPPSAELVRWLNMNFISTAP